MCKRTRTMRSSPRGVALLLVLGMIMAITILALGFIARCDTELAAGQNMAVRMQMDQLATSGLEHARGLLLNPQEVPSVYWTGEVRQQLDADSTDFYDVAIVRDDSDPSDFCTYEISSTAYRERNGRRTGESRLEATLRLDPAVVLWTGQATTLTPDLTVYGDVYCNGTLTNHGMIHGDVFAAALGGTGSKTGRLDTQALSLNWPAVTVEAFTSCYTTNTVPAGLLSGQTYGPYDPPHVLYCSGDLILGDHVTIHNMLIVQGNLRILGNSVTLAAPDNLPALYVTGDLIVGDLATVQIEGLAVVDGRVLLGAGVTDANVRGGLFVKGDIAEITSADVSGNGNYGSVHGNAAWQPSGGQIGGALQFDGTDDYVQTSRSVTALQLSGDCTLAVWMNAGGSQVTWAGILSKCNPNGSMYHWGLQFNNGSPREIVARPADGWWWSSPWATGIQVTDVTGGWHHVAVVREGSTMKSYLDGVLHKTESSVSWFPGWGLSHLNIGANRTTEYRYTGLLDDIRIYSRAISEAEVASLAAGQGTNPAGLLGHWRFDETGDDHPDMTIEADPLRAAIVIGDGAGAQHWSPAAGAFFRSVRRPQP